MKTLSFFLLIFLANLSLFAQKDSLYLLEKQGDSLFLAGQNDQASRVYFRAFLKDILNQRLQDKFGLRNMEQYFSREGYRPFFVKDSTEKANFNLIRQADSLLKVCELEKSLNLYQKITKLKIDTILAKERTKMITQIIDYQENKKDSLASVLVQVVEGIAEQERFNPKLSITDFQKKTYDITSVGDGIYQTALPLGKFVITAEKWGDHEETTEQLMITNFKPHHSLIKMYMVCYLFSINDINFIKNTP